LLVNYADDDDDEMESWKPLKSQKNNNNAKDTKKTKISFNLKSSGFVQNSSNGTKSPTAHQDDKMQEDEHEESPKRTTTPTTTSNIREDGTEEGTSLSPKRQKTE
jgi:hypothetical protein